MLHLPAHLGATVHASPWVFRLLEEEAQKLVAAAVKLDDGKNGFRSVVMCDHAEEGSGGGGASKTLYNY